MNSRFGRAWLLGGYFFLYAPIAWLIFYSFNGSKMVTLWAGFSLRWYADILHDTEVLDAFSLSLKLALLTATSSVILGTMAGMAMAKYKVFRGRTLFIAHINAPLVVPEVITGLSLLLFFVALQNLHLPIEKGLLTIWIGHTSIFASYAAVVINSRLLEMDTSLEEAAMDLGARPFQVFYLVTLPMIAQAMMSSWLLTLTLSLDDVVTSAFLSGPGSTTLPIVIFSRARLGLNPSVNVIASLTVGIVSIGVLGASLWMAHQERRRERDQALAYREAMAGATAS
ncbi:MAG: ABC transporter permease subunit [Burkholderiales bacterium]|nr:ABC transporter permease subunit [Burkholderiales bacterium]